MNSIVKLLFYKTYEDRLSKLKIISFIWFVLCFISASLYGSILYGFFSALAATVPVFAIGLIIRILFIDEDDAVKTVESKDGVSP